MIEVPGARLYAEKTGSGPALVLVPGGGGDAAMYDAVVPLLAKRYTVITFDRRGNSRSPLDSPEAAIGIPRQADDVVAILDHFGIDRSFIFGSSAGALIAVEVIARHATRLLGAVVHEPPMVTVLPEGADSPEARALAELSDIARLEGPLRGFAAFAFLTMPDPPRLLASSGGRAVAAAAFGGLRALGVAVSRVSGRPPGSMVRMTGNTALLMRRELPEFLEYVPDLAALEHARVRYRFATGVDSVGRPYYRPGRYLAERLGVPCEDFPGGHVSYQSHPEEFAGRLAEILDWMAA
ncbi:alpha/beta fold hydrolase [Nonomuraea sp. NPDC050536]|uniref:alpha/beta fold hydrolase n=1 Tax=Nonomuraea sp. NPDC050536 TaxID=3364366 RepID=UPI0037CBD023